MGCEQKPRQIWCKLSNMDGSLEYEGEFVPYSATEIGALEIDAEKTRENKVWVRDALVPIVYLKSGQVLIPAESYQKSKAMLKKDSSNSGRK